MRGQTWLVVGLLVFGVFAGEARGEVAWKEEVLENDQIFSKAYYHEQGCAVFLYKDNGGVSADVYALREETVLLGNLRITRASKQYEWWVKKENALAMVGYDAEGKKFLKDLEELSGPIFEEQCLPLVGGLSEEVKAIFRVVYGEKVGK